MSRLESFGAALIVVGALLGVVLALGLYRWESGSREALALANPSPTPTVAPPAPTPTISLSNQPAGIPTAAATDTPEPTAAPSPTAAAVTPSPAASPAAGSPTAAATTPSPAATAAPAATSTPSLASIGDPAAGSKAFATSCSQCHPGANAGVGPALHGPAFTARFPDNTALKAFIRAGRDVMPAFPASSLSDTNLNNIVAYLRTLK